MNQAEPKVLITALFFCIIFSFLAIIVYHFAHDLLKFSFSLAIAAVSALAFSKQTERNNEATSFRKVKLRFILDETYNFIFIILLGVLFILFNYVFLDGAVRIFLPVTVLINFITLYRRVGNAVRLIFSPLNRLFVAFLKALLAPIRLLDRLFDRVFAHLRGFL